MLPEKKPAEKSDTADQDDDRVVAGKRVGETLRGRFLFARALDQIDDALHRALGRQTPHPNDGLALQVHRAATHRIAEALRNRERFTGEGGFIRRGRAFDHFAIDRKEIARLHQQLIIDA